ncbi:hypothetical protein FQR65_LT18219 [Abscondita terminalis]|nr:hypothetical protein FQR65_LT18219 [Abscondita terminalis]
MRRLKHTTKNALEICSMFSGRTYVHVNVLKSEWTVNLPIYLTATSKSTTTSRHFVSELSEPVQYVAGGVLIIVIWPSIMIEKLCNILPHNLCGCMWISTDPGQQVNHSWQTTTRCRKCWDKVHIIDTVATRYVAPSLTSFGDLNPGYKCIYIDAESTEVIDSETWVLNLLQANSQNVLNWALSYSAKSEYNLTNLRPNEWNNLITKMEVDDHLFQKFYGNYHRHSSVAEAPDQAKRKPFYVI